MESTHIASKLKWKIHEIDSSHDYSVSATINGLGEARYSLFERGVRRPHLVGKTEEEVLQWVKERSEA